MIQEYLIKDKHDISTLKSYSTEKIKQELSKVGTIHILSISMTGENEDSAKILSKIHDEILEVHEFVVLSNGSSEYFNKSLFPHINEFERKLRKLLYLAAVLSENGKVSGIDNIKDLEQKELGPIFDALFTDREFNSKTRMLGKDVSWQYSKKWIIGYIESLDEITLWNQLLGNNVKELSSNYIEVKDFRNDVMHAHDINYSSYMKIKERFKKINLEIDSLLIRMCHPDGENFEQLKGFNSQLSEVLKEQSKLISEAMKPVSEQMEEIKKAFSDLALSTTMDGMTKQISQLSEMLKQLYINSEMDQNFQDNDGLDIDNQTLDEEE